MVLQRQSKFTGGQGVTNGRIYWDTTGVTAGRTYYYQCAAHNDMYGTITLSGSGGTAKRYWNVTALIVATIL